MEVMRKVGKGGGTPGIMKMGRDKIIPILISRLRLQTRHPIRIPSIAFLDKCAWKSIELAHY